MKVIVVMYILFVVGLAFLLQPDNEKLRVRLESAQKKVILYRSALIDSHAPVYQPRAIIITGG